MGQGQADPVGEGGGPQAGGPVRLADQGEELVPTASGDQVDLTGGRGQAAGQCREDGVAAGVSHRAVDGGEAVEVEQDDRQAAGRRGTLFDRPGQPRPEEDAVGQAGQAIVQGVVGRRVAHPFDRRAEKARDGPLPSRSGGDEPGPGSDQVAVTVAQVELDVDGLSATVTGEQEAHRGVRKGPDQERLAGEGAHDLVTGPAQEALGGGVPLDDGAAAIDLDDAVGPGRDEAPQPVLRRCPR